MEAARVGFRRDAVQVKSIFLRRRPEPRDLE